jgi:hypothetical protein
MRNFLIFLPLLLIACSSGISETEVREIVQAEIAGISQGPQGIQGEPGEIGPPGPAGTVSSECHTHLYQIPDGSHSHGIPFNSSSTSFESLFYYDGLRETSEGKAC